MSSPLDLDRYFARIGYDGPRAATLDVLRDLQRLHTQTIPFENLNPLTGRRVLLALPELVAKLVEQRRGGYCYEHNLLFAQVLTQLGFAVTPLSARVLWRRDPATVPARTHMTLRVDIGDDAWMTDVGFGLVTPTAPLRLVAGEAQPTTLEPYRFAAAARDAFDLEVKTGDLWAKVYRFDLQRTEPIDYEVMNWYVSTHPDSFFVANLVACRIAPAARRVLFNDLYTERTPDGRKEERRITGALELDACLRDEFGIDARGIDLAELFERVVSRSEQQAARDPRTEQAAHEAHEAHKPQAPAEGTR
ncbi:arylamine N-acetyltransferase [Paraburkholderia jirisanensis]